MDGFLGGLGSWDRYGLLENFFGGLYGWEGGLNFFAGGFFPGGLNGFDGGERFLSEARPFLAENLFNVDKNDGGFLTTLLFTL